MKHFLCLLIALSASACSPAKSKTPSPVQGMPEKPLATQERVRLEFRKASSIPAKDSEAMQIPGKTTIFVDKKILLDQSSIQSAELGVDRAGRYLIVIRLTEKGTADLARVSTELTGSIMAILLNGKLLIAPHILEPILGGVTQIAGNFSREEAQAIVDGLNQR